jgi:transcriptional regulator with GAF, ATPase, and Fis domain
VFNAPGTKTPKTSARAGKSTPAAPTASQRALKKAKTGIERISAIAAKEEETTQKVLELKKLKAKGEYDKSLARIKAKADLKIEQMKIRAELAQKKMDLAQKKMDNDFQLELARMQMGHAYMMGSSSSIAHNQAAVLGSDVRSVTPIDTDLEFFSQNPTYNFN